jgi:DNA recombination protein RmuC
VPDPLLLIYGLVGAGAVFISLVLLLLFRGSTKTAIHNQAIALMQSKLEQTAERQFQVEGQLEKTQNIVDQLREENRQLSEAQVRIQVQSTESLRSAQEKIDLLKVAREQMTQEFNNLANRIFDEKTERLLQTNKSSLETTLGPLKTQLVDFRKKVEDVYDKETRDRVSLRVELEQLKQLNVQISQDAINLTKALKGDKKTQGNWGEVVLERVLEQSGLRKGSEYETQVNLQAEDGGRR